MPQTSNGAGVVGFTASKGTRMFVLLALLAVLAVAAIVLSLVEVTKDGYRRVPERPLVRIY